MKEEKSREKKKGRKRRVKKCNVGRLAAHGQFCDGVLPTVFGRKLAASTPETLALTPPRTAGHSTLRPLGHPVPSPCQDGKLRLPRKRALDWMGMSTSCPLCFYQIIVFFFRILP